MACDHELFVRVPYFHPFPSPLYEERSRGRVSFRIHFGPGINRNARAPQRAVNENIYLLKVEGAAATIDAMVAEGRISEWMEGGREGGRTVSHVHWSHGDTFLR